MPQNRLEDDPRYKVASPERQAELRRLVYGPESLGSIAPPEVGLRKMDVKPVERSWQENLRDLPVSIPNYWRPSNEPGMEIELGLPTITESLPQTLGVIGGAYGSAVGPAGSVAGYGAGTLGGMAARAGLQKLSPELFGEDKPFTKALAEDVPGHLLNAVIPVGSRLAGLFTQEGRDAMKATFLRTFFKNRLSPEALAAYKADPLSKLTVGQISKVEAPENIFAKPEKELFVGEQHAYNKQQLRDLAEGFSPQEATREARGIEGQRLTKEFIDARRIEEKRLREEVRKIAESNTQYFDYDVDQKKMVQIQPGDYTGSLTQKQVQGPIYLTKTSGYSDKIIPQLEESIERLKTSSPQMTGEIRRTLDLLRGFRSPGKESGIKNIEPYAAVREMKDSLDGLIERSNELGLKAETMQSLSDSLGKDLDNSIKRWGAGSIQKYRELTSAQQFGRNALAKDVQGSVKNIENPSEFFKGAYDSTEKARRYAISSGVKDETGNFLTHNDNPMAREYVTKIFQDFSEKEIFRGKDAFKKFAKDLEEEIPHQFMNKDTRQGLKHILERASIPKGTSEIGSYGLEFNTTGAKLANVAGVLGRRFGLGTIARTILLDPKSARIIAELSTTPAKSGRAKILTRALVPYLEAASDKD